MEEAETVKNFLKSLGELTVTISSKLKEDVLGKTLSETIDEISRNEAAEYNEAVSELEQAKVLNTYAYILVSLYFTSAKLNGIKFNNDTLIMQEIKRVKGFMDRVKGAEESLIKSGQKDNKMEAESESFINKHLREPAVSRIHFQSKDETKCAASENKHRHFDDEESLKQALSSSKIERKTKSDKQELNKKEQNRNSSRTSGRREVKTGRVNKGRK